MIGGEVMGLLVAVAEPEGSVEDNTNCMIGGEVMKSIKYRKL
jgi:hypothetical protein